MNVNEEINFLCWVNKVTNKTGAVKVVSDKKEFTIKSIIDFCNNMKLDILDNIGVESFNERHLNTAEVVIDKNRYSLYAN